MIYLDHAATTHPRPEAIDALERWAADDALGNPSSGHRPGRDARVAVEEARETIATALGASPSEVVFTSGGTEADNLAVKGAAWAGADHGRRHLVVSAVEHAAVLEAAEWLAEHQGFELDVAPVERDGRVDPERVLELVRDDTALVAVMAANNELGAVNDVAAIGDELRDRGVTFHVDAVQAFATWDVDVRAWPVGSLALSAHKFGGPNGVGIAYLRRGVPFTPLLHGGGQDRGVRSGTFAAALDAACGAAVDAAVTDRRSGLPERLAELTDRLWKRLSDLDGVRRNGPADPAWRLPSHLHASLEGIDAEALLFACDQAGLALSGGSACHAGATSTSHVLTATGLDDLAGVRLSLGWTSTDEEIERGADVLTDVITSLRAAGGGGLA
ncbi:MAG: cysteine desulfurase [Actinobacteria bacterium]|nr:cysteine desulfurase [Actinomycetota bacterium]